jgi:MipA family protein
MQSFFNHTITSKHSLASLRLIALTAAMLGLNTASWSQTNAKKADESPWEISVGAGVVSSPEYIGGKKSVSGFAPSVSLAYRTKEYGTFSFGGKGLGLAWTAIDNDDYSLGLSLGQSAARVDNKDGTASRPGSKRLRGMGEIKSNSEVGLFGHYTIGLPIMFELVKGSGDGKENARTLKTDGHGGTRFTLSTEIPWQVSNELSFSLSPSIVWGDSKYNQTYFGVTRAQSARSGFRTYKADSGINSFGVSIGANYKFTPNLSATAALSFEQLRGDAAKSPLVQQKSQRTFVAGVNYAF